MAVLTEMLSSKALKIYNLNIILFLSYVILEINEGK